MPGFADAVREFALCTMGITYQAIPETFVRESLNADAAQLQTLCSARGWKLEGGLVKVTLNDDNTAKARKPEEGGGTLKFEHLNKIMSTTLGLY